MVLLVFLAATAAFTAAKLVQFGYAIPGNLVMAIARNVIENDGDATLEITVTAENFSRLN